MGSVIPAKETQNWGGSLLQFATSLVGQRLEKERIGIAKEQLEVEKAREETTSAYTKALTEQINQKLDEEAENMLNPLYVEAKRQAAVAALSGQVDLADKMKVEAQRAKEEMDLYKKASTVEDKMRILFPHYAAQELRLMQDQLAFQNQIIAAVRADEVERHNRSMEDRLAFSARFGSTINAFAGTPSAADVQSKAEALHVLQSNPRAAPEQLQTAQQSYDDAVKLATEQRWKFELEKSKQQAQIQVGAQKQGIAAAQMAKDETRFYNKASYQQYLLDEQSGGPPPVIVPGRLLGLPIGQYLNKWFYMPRSEAIRRGILEQSVPATPETEALLFGSQKSTGTTELPVPLNIPGQR